MNVLNDFKKILDHEKVSDQDRIDYVNKTFDEIAINVFNFLKECEQMFINEPSYKFKKNKKEKNEFYAIGMTSTPIFLGAFSGFSLGDVVAPFTFVPFNFASLTIAGGMLGMALAAGIVKSSRFNEKFKKHQDEFEDERKKHIRKLSVNVFKQSKEEIKNINVVCNILIKDKISRNLFFNEEKIKDWEDNLPENTLDYSDKYIMCKLFNDKMWGLEEKMLFLFLYFKELKNIENKELSE